MIVKIRTCFHRSQKCIDDKIIHHTNGLKQNNLATFEKKVKNTMNIHATIKSLIYLPAMILGSSSSSLKRAEGDFLLLCPPVTHACTKSGSMQTCVVCRTFIKPRVFCNGNEEQMVFCFYCY